jgi:hypothetical protein
MGDTSATSPDPRPGASDQQLGPARNNSGGSTRNTGTSTSANTTRTATNPFFAQGGHNNANNPSTALDCSTSYTMIYPIRSLLSDVQPSGDPLPPGPSTTTPTVASGDHRLPSVGIGTGGDPDSTSMIRPGMRRSVSIQQKRTAQWQANISDRRPTGSGWLSSPMGWEPQDRDRNKHRDGELVSPSQPLPETNENPGMHSFLFFSLSIPFRTA